jgi:dihydroorotate dehydrogenase (NAD+) catalytic subunit
MSVRVLGLELAHRVINGSGTFDALAARAALGEELDERFPFAAYVSKTITLKPRAGNPPPRLWEAPGGLINSIGLPNKGLDSYIANDVPRLCGFQCRVPGAERALRVPVITNIMGSNAQDFAALIEACAPREEIAAIELNVSCPNVRTGLDIGADPRELESVLTKLRPITSKPMIVKLTPNTADVSACAQAAAAAGADAVSLINTLRALALARPSAGAPASAWLGGGTGGLSGPAVRAVALAQVAAVAERVSIPVIGMGGIETARHARDMLDAGAELVAVGTASFRDPHVASEIARALGE